MVEMIQPETIGVYWSIPLKACSYPALLICQLLWAYVKLAGSQLLALASAL